MNRSASVTPHNANLPERLNGEIKHRAEVDGILPNEAAIVRPVGALMLEQNDARAVCHRVMTPEGLKPVSDDPPAEVGAPTPARGRDPRVHA